MGEHIEDLFLGGLLRDGAASVDYDRCLSLWFSSPDLGALGRLS